MMLWRRFLRADYRILVKLPGGPWDRTYLRYFPPGVVFMVIFAVLVPAAYFLILYFLRHRLQVPTAVNVSKMLSCPQRGVSNRILARRLCVALLLVDP
jgi:hypothetical protein